ncbi:hypothetical protein Dda_5424 [Drechslerella dactyloides]|uniref:NADH dehydrogenase [ubiquinone] 1 alpha subcomplex subunit 1 n=1 Tax=Drechslerella dactyloides TaxID=74499 RepID=A0AAD6IW71_DREDA|nr:hypothetical protein Dda_5424 [Drechslerella dactyloides]
MPVPWETILPFAIVVAMFGISGTGLATSAYVANGYKPKRWALDVWDKQSENTRKLATGKTSRSHAEISNRLLISE